MSRQHTHYHDSSFGSCIHTDRRSKDMHQYQLQDGYSRWISFWRATNPLTGLHSGIIVQLRMYLSKTSSSVIGLVFMVRFCHRPSSLVDYDKTNVHPVSSQVCHKNILQNVPTSLTDDDTGQFSEYLVAACIWVWWGVMRSTVVFWSLRVVLWTS